MEITNLKAIHVFLCAALLAGLYGCTHQQPVAEPPARLHAMPFNVVATGDSRTDPASAATFSWTAASAPADARPGMEDVPVNALLEEAIADTLQQKGYRYFAASGQGDLLVSYTMTLNDAAAERQLAEQYGMQADLKYSSPDPEKFEKGTLVIDIIERQSGLSAWRSSLQGFAYLQLDDMQRRQRIHGMVARMLSGLPDRK